MKIGGNVPVISQTGSDYRSGSKAVAVVEQGGTRQPSSALPSSSVERFEQAFSSESERFFKVDGLSAFAQQAISAYQSTEALSPSNPRHQLIGIDVYA